MIGSLVSVKQTGLYRVCALSEAGHEASSFGMKNEPKWVQRDRLPAYSPTQSISLESGSHLPQSIAKESS